MKTSTAAVPLEKLLEQLETWDKQIRDSKESKTLNPMNAADRRTIHRGRQDYGDIESHSEGEGRDRHIVLEYQAED